MELNGWSSPMIVRYGASGPAHAGGEPMTDPYPPG